MQDLDAKRHSEIDILSGALVKMGKELHIPTPYNEYTYHMIKALEEKNDGLFDYDQKIKEICVLNKKIPNVIFFFIKSIFYYVKK